MSSASKSRRGWSLALGPLFLSAAGILYNLSGMGHRGLYSWQYTYLTRIGTLRLSMSDYYFLAAIFCAICGVVYFVLCTVARRPIEILIGYAHFLVSAGLIVVTASYIRGLTPSGPLEPIPAQYVSVFSLAQVLLLVYVAMAVFSPPPEED